MIERGRLDFIRYFFAEIQLTCPVKGHEQINAATEYGCSVSANELNDKITIMWNSRLFIQNYY